MSENKKTIELKSTVRSYPSTGSGRAGDENKKTTFISDSRTTTNSPIAQRTAHRVQGNALVALVAAHSGGHIIPCLTIAEKEHVNAKILFITSTAPLDTNIVRQSNAIDHLITVPLTTLPYKKPWLWPKALFSYGKALVRSFNLLRTHKPSKVITTGGSISIPVCLAAWALRIPIELFELNVEPGKTVKLLAPLATNIRMVFDETKHYFKRNAYTVTPYPIRFGEHEKAGFDRAGELKKLGFSAERTTIFVIGGSQGSQFLNELIRQWIEVEGPANIQIIHQTGKEDWSDFYKERNIPAMTFAYHHNLAPFYQLADLVITRAGSGTLAELKFFGCKTIIIPLVASTTGHQVENARAYVRSHPELFSLCLQKDIETSPTVINQLMATKLNRPEH